MTTLNEIGRELGLSRDLFLVPSDIAYFNTANIGPRLKSVSAAGHAAIEKFEAPWELQAADWFSGAERLRQTFARLVGCEADSVALIPSISYGMALAARNIPIAEGSEIVVVEDQYPSNFYIWRRRAAEARATIRVAERSLSRSLTESLLDLIGRDTCLVAIPHCHWTDGELIDLTAVSDAVRSANAALVIDASQSLGALPIDVVRVRPDFLVSVGYKWLLGPYGLGYLYAADRWHVEGVPLEESWLTRRKSEDFSRLVDYTDEYRPGARRFDFGEFPQFISVPMATAAISQLESWGIDFIHQALVQRTSRIREFANSIGLRMHPASRCGGHMIGLQVPGGVSATTIGSFASRNVYLSVRGDSIRIAPHLHNGSSDMDLLCEALQSIVPGDRKPHREDLSKIESEY